MIEKEDWNKNSNCNKNRWTMFEQPTSSTYSHGVEHELIYLC